MRARPHLLGIDDGPVEKRPGRDVVLVAVVMGGADLVEGVGTTRFPVDGDDAAGFLSTWVRTLRVHPALAGIVLGGITIGGLGVVDVEQLARATDLPVLVVNRKDPRDHDLDRALVAAGLEDRIPIVARSPEAHRLDTRVFVACAGVHPERAAELVRASTAKSDLPEPLRVAHLIARAVTTGESRGRP